MPTRQALEDAWPPQRDGEELAAPGPLLGGELNADVARAVVGIYRDVAGRGPTHARAFFATTSSSS